MEKETEMRNDESPGGDKSPGDDKNPGDDKSRLCSITGP